MPVSPSGLLQGREVCRLWKWEGYVEGGQPGFSERPGGSRLESATFAKASRAAFCVLSVQLSPRFQKYPCGAELAPNLVCGSFRSVILGGPHGMLPTLPSRRKPRPPASLCVSGVTSTAVPYALLDRTALAVAPPPLLPFVSDSAASFSKLPWEEACLVYLR